MILKAFGFLDLIIMITIFFNSAVPRTAFIYAATYLVIKASLFIFMDDPFSFSNWLNYVDIVIAGYLILLSFGVSNLLLSIVFGLLLLQRAILSLA